MRAATTRAAARDARRTPGSSAGRARAARRTRRSSVGERTRLVVGWLSVIQRRVSPLAARAAVKILRHCATGRSHLGDRRADHDWRRMDTTDVRPDGRSVTARMSAIGDACSSLPLRRCMPDQRYCVECGERRGDRGCRSWTARARRRPRRLAPPPAAAAAGRRAASGATLIAGVGTLLLALGVGVLIGRSGLRQQRHDGRGAGCAWSRSAAVPPRAAAAAAAAGTTTTPPPPADARRQAPGTSDKAAKAKAAPTLGRDGHAAAEAVKVGEPGHGPRLQARQVHRQLLRRLMLGLRRQPRVRPPSRAGRAPLRSVAATLPRAARGLPSTSSAAATSCRARRRAAVGPRRTRLRDGDPRPHPRRRARPARRRSCRTPTPSSARSSGSCAWRRPGRPARAPPARAPHSSGAVYCWQCGQPLLEQVRGDAIVAA